MGLFGNKKQKLQKKYQKLLEKAHKVSHSDRKASDMLMAEAEEVAKQIDQLN